MATWKKVIVSGSQAELAALTASIAVKVGTNQTISTDPILTQLSGSFSGSFIGLHSGSFSGSFTGSFKGDGSGLTGVPAVTPNSLTFGEGIGSTPAGTTTFNGSAPVTITLSGSVDLTNNSVIKWDNNAGKVANSNIFDDGTNVYITGSNIIISGSSTVLKVTGSVSSTGGFTGSLLGNASTATTATNATNVAVTDTTTGTGPYYVTFVSSNTGNQPVLVDSTTLTYNSTTNGLTTGQYTASSGVLVSAGGVNVTAGGVTVTAGGLNINGGNAAFAANVSVQGDLLVAGTASFQNTQNLLVGDRFVALASGSTTVTDGGIVIVSSTAGGGMSGSAWYLETGTGTDYGTYGRWATAFNVHVSASGVNVTQSEFAVTVNVAASSDPSAAPVWGGSTNGSGNMWINNTAGTIWIYA